MWYGQNHVGDDSQLPALINKKGGDMRNGLLTLNIIRAFTLLALSIMLFGCGEKAAGNKTEAVVPAVIVKELTREEKEIKRKAEMGDADAQSELGMVYYDTDAAKAVEWWQKAAAQGNASAQGALGTMYANGLGVPKDTAKAVEWIQKGAAQGDADAQYNLALMYYKGEGVSKDMVRAYAWHNLAASHGAATLNDSDYKDRRDWLETQITPSERAEGQRLSSNWKKGEIL